MLEPPNLSTDSILSCLQIDYGLRVQQVEFLPLGADPDAAVYRAVTAEGVSYFLKLRRGPVTLLTLHFPKLLRDLGSEHIIAPLETRAGRLSTSLQDFGVILYPFAEGRNGYETALTRAQWTEFGATLKRLHGVDVPAELLEAFPRETFSGQWREAVRQFLGRVEQERFGEPVARDVAALLLAKRTQISAFVARADKLARALQTQPLVFVPCHADLHAGNLHIANDTFYLVDWDTLTLAPKERDLMFIGGGLLGNHVPPEEEATLFYEGYGVTTENPIATTYYRYERIIQDIAVYCEQLLDSDEGGADRQQALVYLKANFSPGGTLERAHQADRLSL